MMFTLDPHVISLDHRQGVFSQSFEQFAGRMVNSFRLTKGGRLMQQNAATLTRIEARYGIPGAVVV